ncbi:MAG: sigma-70 family RNA polymerase sigma factor [Thermomicrobiales bacterium]|nr:sigma-70 family RNA polymerase sigma factor [Thermomicrobiales bacterium]
MKLRKTAPVPAAMAPSFVAFYETHAAALLRYCRVRVSNPHEAEDVAATVFTRAFAAWPPDDPATARAWLFTIAHNVVANHYRTKSSRPAPLPIDDAFALPDRSAQPHEIAEQRDIQRAVRAAIGQLTDEQRDVMELRLAGLNGPEIADATGRSHAAVKMLQYRAMQSLRGLLAPPDDAFIHAEGAEGRGCP